MTCKIEVTKSFDESKQVSNAPIPECTLDEDGRTTCPSCGLATHELDEAELVERDINVSPDECTVVCFCQECEAACCCKRGTPSDRPTSPPPEVYGRSERGG